MLKAALEYFASKVKEAEEVKVVKIAGKTYTDKPLIRQDKTDKARAIEGKTLTSLIDYIKGCKEEFQSRLILHVNSPVEVSLCSGLDTERERECLFKAKACLPMFEFDRKHGQEEFPIALQACFGPVGDRDTLAAVASKIVNAQEQSYSDDGMTQEITMKTGVTTKAAALAPNPVRLMPYRTFLEVEQPISDFIFRIDGKGEEPRFMLVEADGGAWKNQAMLTIKEYLEEQLKEDGGAGNSIRKGRGSEKAPSTQGMDENIMLVVCLIGIMSAAFCSGYLCMKERAYKAKDKVLKGILQELKEKEIKHGSEMATACYIFSIRLEEALKCR